MEVLFVGGCYSDLDRKEKERMTDHRNLDCQNRDSLGREHDNWALSCHTDKKDSSSKFTKHLIESSALSKGAAWHTVPIASI